ncbi:MAG: cation:proton antiporter [Candidatus Sericytochromatia bacterium]|nr:cation:proton antiporter [Candidatus Sericytochromatia bacterium]
MTLTQLLLALICILTAAKMGGALMQRLGQPAVLGELLGGLIVGASGFGWIDPHAEVVHGLAELGVLVLLFEVGLETKLQELAAAGTQAAMVALIGVLAPIGLGTGLSLAFGLPWLSALLVGAALSATSIGISARILSERGLLATVTGSIILGAAIIDDVVGVSLLGIMKRLAEAGTTDWLTVGRITAMSIGFIVLVMVVGRLFVPVLQRVVAMLRGRGVLLVTFVTFAFLLAYLAERFGSAALIGAFAAGLLLEETEERHQIETQIKPIADLLTPVFFVSVGAAVDLRLLNPFDPSAWPTLMFTVCLVAVAIVGKLLAGFGAWKGDANRLIIGVGMLARGEVGLIFAGVGATAGLLDPGHYAAVIATVGITTLLAPPWLARIAR